MKLLLMIKDVIFGVLELLCTCSYVAIHLFMVPVLLIVVGKKANFVKLVKINCLFTCIQDGTYYFPEKDWLYISEDAKDLIRHLLVKDASQRYTAEMVLNHPWVLHGGPVTVLETPKVIRRNNSAKDLAAFAESANAMKRLFLRHQAYSTDYSYKPKLSSHFEEKNNRVKCYPTTPETPTLTQNRFCSSSLKQNLSDALVCDSFINSKSFNRLPLTLHPSLKPILLNI